MIKKISLSLGLFFLILFLVGCGGSTTPDVPKPHAVLTIAVSPEPLAFSRDFWTGFYSSTFQVIVSEANGVAATLTTVSLRFIFGNSIVYTLTAPGGSVPAHGTFGGTCSPVVPSLFSEMKIVLAGADANGYPVNVQKSWFFTVAASGRLEVRR